MVDRHFVPPLNSLIVFEAAIRYSSFTRAAEQCGITQGAVSRQIKNLEEMLGTKLFIKDGRNVRATEAAKAYQVDIRQGLEIVEAATRRIMTSEGSHAVRLGVLPTLSSQWLIPRLNSFIEENPSIAVPMTIKPYPFEFADQSLDAAIHVGEADWPNVQFDLMFHERAVLVGSPELVEKYQIRSPGDFAKAPLISGGSKQSEWPHAYGWSEFFRANGVEHSVPPVLQLATYASISNSAAASQGFAIIPSVHIERELQTGQLVVAYGDEFLTGRAYYFVYPPDRMNYPSFRRFRDWILAQASDTRLSKRTALISAG